MLGPGQQLTSYSSFFLRVTLLRRSHHLRYVLRNRATDQVYLVVLFSIYLKEDLDEATGDIKAEMLEADEAAAASRLLTHDDHGEDEHHDEEKVLQEARSQFEKMGVDTNKRRDDDDDDERPPETSLDDLD